MGMHIRRFLASGALALAGGITATPVLAGSPFYFVECDGYGTPTAAGDGMVKEARGLFGLIAPLGSAGNTRRSSIPLGSAGVAACDQALADPRLLETQWLRRASLLRARAIHDLAISNPDAALADLDKATSTLRTPEDMFIKRSMVMGIDMVRAFALREKGDLAGAESLVTHIARQRPYNRQTIVGLDAIGGDVRWKVDGQPLHLLLARLAPKMVGTEYAEAFGRGDFAEVVALYPQLLPPLQLRNIGTGKWDDREVTAKNERTALLFGAESRSYRAYALAALGRSEEARKAMEEADAFVTQHTPAPLSPVALGEKESDKAAFDRLTNQSLINAAGQAQRGLGMWREAIKLRIDLPSLSVDQVIQRLGALSRSTPMEVVVDLARQVRSKTGDPQFDGAIATLEKKIRAQGATDLHTRVTRLFEAIPHSEIKSPIPTYRKANSEFVGYLWGGIDGFKTLPNDNGSTTIRFVGERASSSVVEEMALLRAADFARENGKTGFVIVDRRDYERTQNATYYGVTVRSDPAGYSTEIDIVLVDQQAPPERFAGAPWRILSAQSVIDALGPVYASPSVSKPPS
jgi:hypothetical protein